MRLEGKVALVTGSTRGIGRSIAERFAAQGAKVAVTGRTVDRGEKVVARIRDAGGEAQFIPLDITEEESVSGVVAATVERFGSLTTLVNNAAPTDLVAGTMKPLVDYSTEEWERIMLGTLTGNVFWATKYAWPHLVEAGNASIINISSAQAVVGLPGFSAYGAAKGGMNSVTKTVAVEGGALGVRCNCIVVGRVVSSAKDVAIKPPGHLTRIGHPDDIAHAAVWLAADESEFVTGSTVTADGGFTINAGGVGEG